MSSTPARYLVALLACLLAHEASAGAGNVTESRLRQSLDDGRNWLVKGGNARGQHYSPLTRINDDNVARLGLAWAADIPAPDGIAGTPIVVDGVAYLAASHSVAYAIDANDGKLIWSYDPDVAAAFAANPYLSWSARASRGLAVWKRKVYVTTADCRLIALDDATGKPAWTRTTCDIALGYAISDSPYVGGDKVFVGNSGSESGEKNRGYVSAYDAASGELLWRFYTVPSDDPSENTSAAMKMAARTWSGDALARFGGGGSAWNEMTYDPESGLLYFGTAGGLPYAYSVRSPGGGDNLFLSSVVAVDADTGEYVWHYQTVPEDSWEYNATMNIALADFEVGGARHKTLLIAPKNGFHYILDRLTGELIAADKFAKVNWASHINMETGRPVYSPEAEYWTAEPGSEVRVWPNMWGAHSWQPMAWHPKLRLSYIPVVDIPSIVTNYEDGDFTDRLETVDEVDGKPFSPGKLVAFDPLDGKARWTVHHELPFNGGVLATAGNLIFQGDASGRFSAYSADTGVRLWSVRSGTSILAAPVSYAIDDRQYIVVPVGSGGGVQFVYPELLATEATDGPTRLLAFSLDGDTQLPGTDTPESALPEQPELDASPARIAAGAEIYGDACGFCHGSNAVARAGGSVPDLRYASVEVHDTWQGIVRCGLRRAKGMPAFDMSPEDAEAVRAYVLSQSEALRQKK